MTTPDWPAIEREFRAGQLSIKELGRQHSVSDTAIRKRAKALGWTRDLSGAVRTRVRESLVREEVRANQSELMGVVPSEAAIVNAAVQAHHLDPARRRRDIAALRQAAAGLLAELAPGARAQRDGADGILVVPIRVIDRSRVIADLSLLAHQSRQFLRLARCQLATARFR